MPCFFSTTELKGDMDAVGESITHFARSFEGHTVKTRQILQKLFQLLQECNCDDADSKKIKKLCRDYVTSETELDTGKNAVLARTNTLLQTFPDNKKYKSGSSYSVSGRKMLERYLTEPKQELPVLRVITEGDCNSKKNKIRDLEQELERCKNDKSALDRKIMELTKENQELQESLGSEEADNKERQGQGKTILMENKLAPLNKPIAKEEERMVKRQDSSKKKPSDNYGKQREFKPNNDNQNTKNDNKVNKGNIRNVASVMTAEHSCQERFCVPQEEFDDLKNKLKSYELDTNRIKDENNRLNDVVNDYELKSIKADTQETKLKTQMKQLAHDNSCFKSQLEIKNAEIKKLHFTVDQTKKETESLKCRVSDKMVIDKKVLEKIKQENERLQREKRSVQTENSELNEKLQNSKKERDILQQRTLDERSKQEQIIQEKAAIEKEMNEIRRKLTESLESRSAMINEEKCISEKLKEEKEAFRREIDKFQKLSNERHAEIVTEKEAADDRLSKMRIDYESRLEEFTNLSTKVQHDASETEKKLNKNIYGFEKDLKKEKEQNKQLESQVKVLSERITNLETEIQKEQEKNANKETEIETSTLRLKDITKNHEELKLKLVQAEENTRSEMEISNIKIADLSKDKTLLTKQLRGLKDNIQDLQTSFTTQKTTYEANISDLMNNMEQLQEQKLEAEETLAALEVGHRELQQLYETAMEELDQFKRIKTIQIQLYYNSRSSLISKVENELKSLLKREIESNTVQLEFINREKVNDIDPSEPLLIICICASRLGTDAANAVQSLKLTSNMALLVFHHKDGHALPNQASEHVLTGNEYKRLGGIFDFGFLSGKGIYSCEMNDQNFKNILHFIRKEH